MAKVTITITDLEPEGLDILLESDPPVNGAEQWKNSVGQLFALQMVEAITTFEGQGIAWEVSDSGGQKVRSSE